MSESILNEYRALRKKRMFFLLFLLLLLLLITGYAFTTGGSQLSMRDLLNLFLGNSDEMTKQVFLNIRLPRILAALITGVSLAISGAVMQVTLRNPLASPYTLGISSSAAFGAALAIVLFGGGLSVAKTGSVFYFDNPYVIALSSFLCSLSGLVLILFLSRIRKSAAETIILAGIIISSLFSAGISALQYIADKVQLSTLIFWSFGDLSRANWFRLILVCSICLPVILFIYFNRWNYKALRYGDEYASSLGVNPVRTRCIALVCCTICTAVVVSFFGVIAFVGLVVPHIVRFCVGSDESVLIPYSALCGGLFLLLCDTLGKTLFSPIVIPVGIITSFVGVPVFLLLLFRNRT